MEISFQAAVSSHTMIFIPVHAWLLFQAVNPESEIDVCKVTIRTAVGWANCWSRLYQAMLEVRA